MVGNIMQRKTRSLLEELESVSSSRDTGHLLESRANNVIASAVNLLEMIYKSYPAEKAEILERRLLNAIKNRDANKFEFSEYLN